MSRKHYFVVAATAVAALWVSVMPSSAQDGLAGIHDWVRVGNKTCMKDHFHSGSSAGQPSKKQAEAQAISGWASFTAWEYSGLWARWSLAESRTVKCDKDGANWSCNVEARPCKGGAGRRR